MYHLLTQPVQRTVQKIRNFAIEENFIGKPFKVGENFFKDTLGFEKDIFSIVNVKIQKCWQNLTNIEGKSWSVQVSV